MFFIYFESLSSIGFRELLICIQITKIHIYNIKIWINKFYQTMTLPYFMKKKQGKRWCILDFFDFFLSCHSLVKILILMMKTISFTNFTLVLLFHQFIPLKETHLSFILSFLFSHSYRSQ